LRGVRRERLRRETEEAKARIAAGEPVRLTHVVELPVWKKDGSDNLDGARRMSPAVGDAARRFAPDAPVARLVENGASQPQLPDIHTPEPLPAEAVLAAMSATETPSPAPVVPVAMEKSDPNA